MSVLVRKHGVNCDKTNFKKVNLKEGLRSLGKTGLTLIHRPNQSLFISILITIGGGSGVNYADTATKVK